MRLGRARQSSRAKKPTSYWLRLASGLPAAMENWLAPPHQGGAIAVEGREGERASVVRRVLIPQIHASQKAAPSQQVNAMSHGGHVLDFDAVLVGEGECQGRAAAGEGVEDDGSGEIGIAVLAGAQARVAGPRLIYGMRAIDAGFGELHCVLAVAVVIDPARKREAAGALVVNRHAGEGVAQGQGLILG